MDTENIRTRTLGDAWGWGCYQSVPNGPWFWYAYTRDRREEGEERLQGMAEVRAKGALRRLQVMPPLPSLTIGGIDELSGTQESM